MSLVCPSKLRLCLRTIAGILALGALIFFGGCFGQNGDDASRSESFAAPDGSFRIEYSVPPWKVAHRSSDSIRLHVDTEVFGFTIGESLPPTHILLAAKVNLQERLDDIIDPDDLKAILEDAGIDTEDVPDDFTGDTSTLDTETDEDTSIPEVDPESRLPEYLQGVDLSDIRDVAVAELNFLVREQDAQIVDELQRFTTDAGLEGVVYQVVVDPGVFIRNVYLPTKDHALRVGALSVFDLNVVDVDIMMRSVTTDRFASVGQE